MPPASAVSRSRACRSEHISKLGIGGLLHDGVRLLGAAIGDCGRLPALPYMLRRGSLPKRYGAQACQDLIPLAEQMLAIPTPQPEWLDRLVLIQEINPGEAQLFAAAAESPLIVMTGDNRALRALKTVNGFPAAVSGRIVSSEAILLALCDDLGHEHVRQGLGALVGIDKTLRVCFSPENPDPREALLSYYRSLASELDPLVLWNPRTGGGL